MAASNLGRTISHRELRNNSGEVLRAVAAGETFIVTNNGEPVAELGPVQRQPYSGLTVQRGDRTGSFRDLVPAKGTETTAESIEFLRGER